MVKNVLFGANLDGVKLLNKSTQIMIEVRLPTLSKSSLFYCMRFLVHVFLFKFCE